MNSDAQRPKIMARRWQGVVCGAAVVALAGCAGPDPVAARWSFADARARVKHLAPTFELQDLVEGKLAIAAISGLGRDEADCQWHVSHLLIDGLGIKMPALEIVPLDDVRELVGRERHRALTAEVGE